jgi:hypothetical protein
MMSYVGDERVLKLGLSVAPESRTYYNVIHDYHHSTSP